MGRCLELQRRNVEVLTEQLKQTRDRFNVGEVDAHRCGASRIPAGGWTNRATRRQPWDRVLANTVKVTPNVRIVIKARH
jgi:hypothetical protein